MKLIDVSGIADINIDDFRTLTVDYLDFIHHHHHHDRRYEGCGVIVVIIDTRNNANFSL